MIRVSANYELKGYNFDTEFTVWKPEEKGKIIIARASTSRKCDPEYDKNLIESGIAKPYKDDYYVDSNWRVLFVGEAYNRAKKYNITDRDKIIKVRGDLSNEPYVNENGEKIYSNPTLKIFNFEFKDTAFNNNNAGLDTPPVVAKNTTEDEDAPY